MYIRQLSTFLKVVELGSFNKAAEHLYISSSAVIQQMNALERDFGVTLFRRSRSGLRLTAAGEYLVGEAKEFIRQNDQLRNRLLELDSQKPSIVVGTTMEEKCRLLYDLWILFKQGNTRYDIRLEVAQDRKVMPRQAQLVESIRDGAVWQKGWLFLEFFRSPLYCGVVKDHPLARKTFITLQDLREHGIVFIDRSTNGESTPLLEMLTREKIPFEARPEWSGTLVWECAIRKRVLVVPYCWNDILVDLLLIPCELDFPVPYGFFYRADPPAPLAEFLDFVQDIYHGANPETIIPML